VRILKVSQTYYPFLSEGGRPAKVSAIARRLTLLGHQVSVLTVDFGVRSFARDLDNLKPSPWGWQAAKDGVEIHFLPALLRYRTLTWNPAVSRFCADQLPSFDVVHIYGLYDLLGPAVARACLRRGLPYVVEPIGMFQPLVRSLWLKRIYHLWLGSRLLRHARRIIATSEQERDELLRGGLPESKIVIRRNGIDPPAALPPGGEFRKAHNLSANTKLVLYLGRLVPKKSPDLLIEAFARWRAGPGRELNAKIVLAGPDEGDGYRQRLENLAARLRLGESVLFPGPLYGQEKWAAYRDADVFVLPSQNENFGNTAAEAVACGTPVIVTDRCGISPWVDGRAGLVVSYQVEAIHGALTRLLGDNALCERLRAGCLGVTQSLSWDEPIALQLAIYRHLIPGGTG
jgi:glycosyltransferase involved in cell wall biosynthesis